MATLTDLHVETVSFVSRAAVRDPQRKDEPRRLLLWKSENARSHMAGLQEALSKVKREKKEAEEGREAALKAQQTAEEKLAKAEAEDNNKESETDMATTLTGSPSETELDLPQQQTLAQMIRMLEPHENHPTLGALLEKVKGAAGDSDDRSEALEKVEKSLIEMSGSRDELRKSDAGPAVIARHDKAERSLQDVYAYLSSGAYQGERGELLNAIQKSECGVGWMER